ncbi:MAG: basic secretory family protein [Myxococcales bacterium]|nr:basic secretory family protein [Myxococcales bacterium]
MAETRHFRFYFTAGSPRTVAYLMQIADATFERLNRFYRYKPARKITVTVVSYTGYSNGFADSAHDRITIFPTPPNFHSRGRTAWLQNVFTHELSHILSINAATPWTKNVPLVLGTGVARTGGAQGLLRLPLYGRNLPHWFVEGVAQFDTYLLGRDAYDENRAAFQRAAWEDGLFFPLGKLAFYGGEQWYNTGFSFLIYLEERFGNGSVHRLFRAAGRRLNPTFDGLFEQVLGVPLSRLEADYRDVVELRYSEHERRVRQGLYDGKPLRFEEQAFDYRDLTPAQRDDLRNDYKATPLRVIDGTLYFLAGRVIQGGRFDPKGRLVSDVEALGEGFALAPHTDDSFFVLRQADDEPGLLPYWHRPDFDSASLFLVEREGEERRLLHESRLTDMDVCAARSELAGVYNDGDGSLRLALYAIEGFGRDDVRIADAPRFILPEQPFDEVRDPRYSPDCKRLYFSRRVGDDHDIYYWDFERAQLSPFATEEAFELYPAPSAEGVYYVSARDGTMSIYFRPEGQAHSLRVTEALTAHHYPVPVAGGVLLARLYGTGFQMHYARGDFLPGEVVTEVRDKAQVAAVAAFPQAPRGEAYNGFHPDHVLTPQFVPLFDIDYDDSRSFGADLRMQAGIEMALEDQLRSHQLLLRTSAGNRSSVFFNYRNQMTALTLQARLGLTQIRSLYTYDGESESYDHVTDYRWGFVYGSASLPLNLFHTLTLGAETIRDLGATVGARARPYDFVEPRFARDMLSLTLDYSGLDRSDPTFRERDINRRGYRELTLSGAFAVEEVHTSLAASSTADDPIEVGRQPYARASLRFTEYLALPDLFDGFFDHTLQVDLQLGYISRDVRFIPFFGGGRLVSMTAPELNTSVGFVGYGSFGLAGETLANLGLSYRFPLLRRLGWDLGPLFIEDIYAQVFGSGGNIWGFDANGDRQVPFRDRAENGRRAVADVGLDLRLLTFFQQLETNVGTTLRMVYRVVPLTRCPGQNVEEDPGCLGDNGAPGMSYFLIVGGGF